MRRQAFDLLVLPVDILLLLIDLLLFMHDPLLHLLDLMTILGSTAEGLVAMCLHLAAIRHRELLEEMEVPASPP